MKNKIIILSLFSLLLSACKNPFVAKVVSEDLTKTESLEKEDEITEQPIDENLDQFVEGIEEETAVDSEKDSKELTVQDTGTNEEKNAIQNKAIVTFNSCFVFEDIIINSKINGYVVSFTVNKEANFYEWHIGDVIFSNSKICEIDFSAYVDGIYPIVLYSQIGDVIYSSFINVIKQDGIITTDTITSKNAINRTVFPNVNKNELTQIKLEITSGENVVVGKGSWSNYTDFSKTKISIKYGIYTFTITARHKQNNVFFQKQIEIDKEMQVVDVNFQFEKMSGTETGVIDTLIYLKNEYNFSDVIISLYKKNNDNFVLYNTGSLKYGQLDLCKGKNDYSDYQYFEYVLSDVDYGVYWLRIDCILANGTKGCYYVDYVYVASGENCKIETKVDNFFDLFTIDYKNNGGFYIGDSLMTKVSQFDNLIVPDEKLMVKPGYEFVGWFLDKNMVLPFKKNGIGNIQQDTVLYAKWDLIQGNEVENGVGLVSNSKIRLEEKSDGISLEFLMEMKADLITIEAFDSDGRILTTDINYIEKGENDIYSADISFRCRKNDIYMVEISAFKTSYGTDSCIYKEKMYTQKQIFKALYNH